ncbi:MAG: hypothetical protein Q8941_02565 [Bacteroidota bacterium]|nr:hypothetical protein [Bacteroidota bacterium]
MRILLFILVALVAFTSTIGGLFMISYPEGNAFEFTADLFEGAFLKNFLVPGITLVLVGSINLVATFSTIQRRHNQYNWSLAGGIAISVWILVEIIILQVIHWSQFGYLIGGILIILLSLRLKGKWAV